MSLAKGFEHFVKRDEPLAPHTWFHLGGPAEFFAAPKSVEDLQALARRSREEGTAIRLLGGGSNLLVRDEGVSGLVVRLAAPAFTEIAVGKKTVTAGGGTGFAQLVVGSADTGAATRILGAVGRIIVGPHDLDHGPVGIELFGDDHGQGGDDLLTHFAAVHDDAGRAVTIDGDPDVGFEG